MEILLHPSTDQAIQNFVSNPSHSLLINAPMGSGKLHLAEYLSATLLGIKPTKLRDNPYYLLTSPIDGSISIDSIRQLKSFVQLKTTGTRSIRRVLVIEQANLMTREAQNALLKLLEEPPTDTVIILTADSTQKILPTILSRLQKIPIHRPSIDQITELFKDTAGPSEVTKAYHISDGRVGLMHALLNSDEPHPLAGYVDVAKDILQKPPYERLVMIPELSNQDLEMLCRTLYSVAHAALVSAVEKGNQVHIKRWYQACKSINQSQSQLQNNPQSKLLLTNLFLNL